MSWRNLSLGTAPQKGFKMGELSHRINEALDSLKGIAETEAIDTETPALKQKAIKSSISGLFSLFIATTGTTYQLGIKNREVRPWFRKLSAINAAIEAFRVILAVVELKRRSKVGA